MRALFDTTPAIATGTTLWRIARDGDPTALPARGIWSASTPLRSVWAELAAALRRRYSSAEGPMEIRATCIDTGDQSTNVYKFVREAPRSRRIYGIKGRDTGPIWPDKVSRANLGKIDLRSVNVAEAKGDIYHRLRVPPGSPGYSHFPAGRDEDYFAELTAESLVVSTKKGTRKAVWSLPAGRRNEALDCRVYAYAALQGLIRQGAVKISESMAKAAPTTERVDSAALAVQPAPLTPRAKRPPRPARSPSYAGASGDWW